MANNFAGYLIATYNATGQLVKFPLNYIKYDSYSSTPKQREEIKAYRDENTRELYRITAEGMKTKITFSTRANLHLADKTAIQKFFTDYETNSVQRKIRLSYWDDEQNVYNSGYFYRPNMEFKIVNITENDIIYSEMNFELIEY